MLVAVLCLFVVQAQKNCAPTVSQSRGPCDGLSEIADPQFQNIATRDKGRGVPGDGKQLKIGIILPVSFSTFALVSVYVCVVWRRKPHRERLERVPNATIVMLQSDPLNLSKNLQQLKQQEELEKIETLVSSRELGVTLACWPATLGALNQALQAKPYIVYISGHCDYSNLLLENTSSSEATSVSLDSIKQLLSTIDTGFPFVFLGVCDSRDLGSAIANHGSFVLATTVEIFDSLAIRIGQIFVETVLAFPYIQFEDEVEQPPSKRSLHNLKVFLEEKISEAIIREKLKIKFVDLEIFVPKSPFKWSRRELPDYPKLDPIHPDRAILPIILAFNGNEQIYFQDEPKVLLNLPKYLYPRSCHCTLYPELFVHVVLQTCHVSLHNFSEFSFTAPNPEAAIQIAFEKVELSQDSQRSGRKYHALLAVEGCNPFYEAQIRRELESRPYLMCVLNRLRNVAETQPSTVVADPKASPASKGMSFVHRTVACC